MSIMDAQVGLDRKLEGGGGGGWCFERCAAWQKAGEGRAELMGEIEYENKAPATSSQLSFA